MKKLLLDWELLHLGALVGAMCPNLLPLEVGGVPNWG